MSELQIGMSTVHHSNAFKLDLVSVSVQRLVCDILLSLLSRNVGIVPAPGKQRDIWLYIFIHSSALVRSEVVQANAAKPTTCWHHFTGDYGSYSIVTVRVL